MNPIRSKPPMDAASGMTLIEVMIALIVLSIGIMALARILPAGSRSELSSRMQSTAVGYGNDVFESVRGLPRTDAQLSAGRHPAAAFDTLGTLRSWRRYYIVTPMAAPLDSLVKIDAMVFWRDTKPESLRFTSYIRP